MKKVIQKTEFEKVFLVKGIGGLRCTDEATAHSWPVSENVDAFGIPEEIKPEPRKPNQLDKLRQQ